MAESRNAIHCLDDEGVLGVWAEPPDDDATHSQATMGRLVQNTVVTWGTGTGQSLKRREEGWGQTGSPSCLTGLTGLGVQRVVYLGGGPTDRTQDLVGQV